MLGALLVAVVPLALVIGYVLFKGIGQLSGAWFTEDLPTITRKAGGGMGPAIVGTLRRRDGDSIGHSWGDLSP